MVSLCVLLEQAAGVGAVRDALRAGGLDGRLVAGGPEVSVDGVVVRIELGAAPLADELLAEPAAHATFDGAAELLARHRGWARAVAADGSGLRGVTAASRVAGLLLALPGALALLDEPGRALTAAERALPRLADLGGPVLPLELWVAVRRYSVADADGLFIDTLGMTQLGLPDLEAYAAPGVAGDAVAAWIRNLALYLAQQGAPIKSGDTLDGPDEQPWVACEDDATVEPPRAVVRFSPL
jgi:hypothetical protein